MTVPEKRGAVITSMLTSRSRSGEMKVGSEWSELNRRIRDGRVIPILSDSLRLDMIFSDLLSQAEVVQQNDSNTLLPVKMRAENLLSQVWAEQIHYPLPDSYDLARVCQFHRAIMKDDEESKALFLVFMKEALLGYAENIGTDLGLVRELYTRFNECTFADMAHELGLPHIQPGRTDPLRVLAQLPISIYFTTSFYNFLERALIAEGKHPITQTCLWNNRTGAAGETSFDPTPESPLVYHLFGSEVFPKSLVLSEEDYLDFLVKVTTDQASIPIKLRSILSSSSLILLGYRLQDWDFRVLFRGIVDPDKSATRGFGLVIQLSPDQQFNVQNVSEAREYLEMYFKPKQFIVSWDGIDGFLNKLFSEWNRWRGNE